MPSRNKKVQCNLHVESQFTSESRLHQQHHCGLRDDRIKEIVTVPEHQHTIFAYKLAAWNKDPANLYAQHRIRLDIMVNICLDKNDSQLFNDVAERGVTPIW